MHVCLNKNYRLQSNRKTEEGADHSDRDTQFRPIRKTIEISADLCQAHGLSDWRQSAYNLRQFKLGSEPYDLIP